MVLLWYRVLICLDIKRLTLLLFQYCLLLQFLYWTSVFSLPAIPLCIAMAIEIKHKNNPSQTCKGLFTHINSTAYFLMNILGVSVSEQNELKKIAFNMKNMDDIMTDPRCPVILGELTCRKQIFYIFQKPRILPVTTGQSVPDGLIYFSGKQITPESLYHVSSNLHLKNIWSAAE